MTERETIIYNSALYRGWILHECTLLERFMDLYLTTYFCKPDVGLDFLTLVLGNNRLSLDGKRKVIETIFKKIKFDLKNEFTDYNIHMNVAMKERNVFAHNTLEMSDEGLKKSATHVGFYRFGLDHKAHWYTADDIQEIVKSINKCSVFFENISEALRLRTS